ncbi:MAG: rhodanese-like domain-containing protein [Magnetococcus sp. DMHC-1]|nr:hypothetical protein [Magnetococcales bacterium]
MFSLKDNSRLSIEEFLADPTTPILIDVRGSTDADPTIPGSIRVYVLDIDEHTSAFEKRFESQLARRPMLLYCSKGESSGYLQKKFSKKYRVLSLQGGMVAYLTTISRLLHDHPYGDSKKKGDTMVKLLKTLTNRETDPATFRKIVNRLLSCTPNPKFKKLVR